MGITVANGATSAGASGATKTALKRAKKSRKALHIAPPRMKSRRKARQVTTNFHRLTHELDRLKKQKNPTDAEQQQQRNERIAAIIKQLEKLGGCQAYQDASILSTSFHRTSKWVFQLLTSFGLRPKAKQLPLRVLEVGAINTQLLSCPWLDVRAIDLNSRHERIEECDFFSLQPVGEFQVIVSSMVLNCVPGAHKRGEMLRMYRKHLMKDGLLFLMLPLLCLRHSHYMTYVRFTKILKAVGFRVRETKNSPKVAFFCLERIETVNEKISFPQQLLMPGGKRNGFSVVI